MPAPMITVFDCSCAMLFAILAFVMATSFFVKSQVTSDDDYLTFVSGHNSLHSYVQLRILLTIRAEANLGLRHE